MSRAENPPRRARNRGELRYRVRCIDKLKYPFRGDESLLDVGCGDGGVARLLRARVRDVTAVDVVAAAGWRDGPGLTFQTADGEALPFDDGSFDLVHAKDSLHHMHDPERALSEFRRVLRSDGAALLVEANRHNPSFYVQMTVVRRHDHFTRRRFHELVQSAFPGACFGSFDAHYVPGADRLLGLQNLVEEGTERLPLVRALASYNFAVTAR